MMAEAMIEELSPTEEGAFGLSQAAVMLDQAREDASMLATALEKNMEVWIAIRLMVGKSDNLSEDTKTNLIKLSQFVADTTMTHGIEIPSEAIDTLININLQISEGFLEGK
ncbi:MAG: flagellar biosynthesis regulator FlaF [Magnetovibrionaceae bacterium]